MSKLLRYSCDAIFKATQASKYGSSIANNCCKYTNYGQRTKKTQPSSPNVRWRHKSKHNLQINNIYKYMQQFLLFKLFHYFPRKGQNVHEVIHHWSVFFVASIYIHRLGKLLSPAFSDNADRFQVLVDQISHFVCYVFQVYVQIKL